MTRHSRSEKIFELRTYLDLSKADFGRAIGYSGVHVSRLEKGDTVPGDKLIERICSVFGVNPLYFTESGESCEPEISVQDAVEKPRDSVEVYQGLAARLKSVRTERGMSQHELGRRSSVEPSHISRVENHGQAITMPTVEKLAEALEVGTDWLMNGDENKKDFPVNQKLINWLWEKKDIREKLWELMKSEEE